MPHRNPLASLFALLSVAVFAQTQTRATPPPPDTEIFLAPLTANGPSLTVGRPANITNSPGYDNQPSFRPDGGAILFTSIRGGTQTDIYQYDVASGATARVTNTPESEYSPTVTPDGGHISVIRVEADGTQRLWQFGRFALVQRIPPAGANGEAALKISELDPKSRQVTPLINAVAGAKEADCAWTPDGMLLMAEKDVLYGWRRGEMEWKKIADLAALGLHGVSRIAVSPKGDRIAFVATP